MGIKSGRLCRIDGNFRSIGRRKRRLVWNIQSPRAVLPSYARIPAHQLLPLSALLRPAPIEAIPAISGSDNRHEQEGSGDELCRPGGPLESRSQEVGEAVIKENQGILGVPQGGLRSHYMRKVGSSDIPPSCMGGQDVFVSGDRECCRTIGGG